ncbi:MAG: hypothetical protein AAF664_03025 [Planctomycetota bacterium]
MREQYPELLRVIGDLPSLPFDPRRQPSETDESGNLRDRVVGAMSNPLDFPPLNASVIEGDRLALAVDPRIPNLSDILFGIVDFFGDCKLAGIDIVLWDEVGESLVRGIQERLAGDATVHVHRGDQREELRYLEADIDAEAVYVPRVLGDADMVIPLTLDQHHGDPTLLFPMLVDTATIERFHDTGGKLTEEQSRIGWSLGIMVQMVIKPDQFGGVGEIEVTTVGREPLSGGALQHIRTHGGDAVDDEDEPPEGSQSDLTIVTLSGGENQQSWPSVARAVGQAASRTNAGGVIVVWTSIDSHDENDHSFCADQDDDAAEITFPPHRPVAAALSKLAGWCRDHSIYIRSDLEDEVVEGFGMAAIHDGDDLQRLVQASGQSMVIWAADQLALP